QWSAPAVIADAPGYSMGQPVFLPRPDGALWLFFNVIMERDWTSAIPHWQRSHDGGVTWSPAERLMDAPGLMFRSKPLALDNRIILPGADERAWRGVMLVAYGGGQGGGRAAPEATAGGGGPPCGGAL